MKFLTSSFGPRIGWMIACTVRPVYVTAKFARAILGRVKISYQRHAVPFLAVECAWLLWPAYKLLKALRICFVINIIEAVGHIIYESDNFFRMLRIGEIDPRRRYVLIANSDYRWKSFVELYKHQFRWAVASNFIYYLFLPIILRYRDIVFDAGLSGWKLRLPNTSRESYWHRISRSEVTSQIVAYYIRRSKCPDYLPLKEAIKKKASDNNELREFLNGKPERLALIHVRVEVGNATARPTEPETYIETLAYLANLRYRLIFVGREKMPETFRRYDVVNYAESSIASFKNDILLFNLADLVITAGSGINYLADCYGKPYLYLNSWHLGLQPPSRYCVSVPALVQRNSGEFIKFSEQIQLYLNSPLRDKGDALLPSCEYQARNATSDEILAALQQLMLLKGNYQARSKIQERFRQLNSGCCTFFGESRVSEYFLEKHSDLF